MHNRVVADGASRPDRQRRSEIGVKHGAVLDVAAVADRHGFVVAAQNGAEPDAHINSQRDAPDDVGIGSDPVTAGLGQDRYMVVKSVDGHRSCPLARLPASIDSDT